MDSQNTSLYAAKPVFDPFEAYSLADQEWKESRTEEKQRRTGISSTHLQDPQREDKPDGLIDTEKDSEDASASPTDPAGATGPEGGTENSCTEPKPRFSDVVFPSLTRKNLDALGLTTTLERRKPLAIEELQSKYFQLSLAFKSDRVTLQRRWEVLQRQRDVLERNFDEELTSIGSDIQIIHKNTDSELADVLMRLMRSLDILAATTKKLVSASEVWGAVQQEWKISGSLQVLLSYVENVEVAHSKDQQELQDLRKLLTQFQVPLSGIPVANGGDVPMKQRAISLSDAAKQERRRISLGGAAGVAAMITRTLVGRRASLLPNLRPFGEGFLGSGKDTNKIELKSKDSLIKEEVGSEDSKADDDDDGDVQEEEFITSSGADVSLQKGTGSDDVATTESNGATLEELSSSADSNLTSSDDELHYITRLLTVERPLLISGLWSCLRDFLMEKRTNLQFLLVCFLAAVVCYLISSK